MKYKIFISYSTKDLATVEQFRLLLIHPSIKVFIAEHDVKPGESLLEKIYPSIQNCHTFILLWSKNSEMSEWVKKEIEIARANKRKILPVLLDGKAVLPKPLDELKYLPFHSDPEYVLGWLRENIYGQIKNKESDSWFWLVVGAAFIWLLTRE